MPAADYSIIVPAYKEAGNLRPLVTRIFAALSRVDSPVPASHVEVIIVDDNSRDGSEEVVQTLQREGYDVRIIVRTTERGLSSAVVRGFQEAQGDNMLCMDADLQVSLFCCWLSCCPSAARNRFRGLELALSVGIKLCMGCSVHTLKALFRSLEIESGFRRFTLWESHICTVLRCWRSLD